MKLFDKILPKKHTDEREQLEFYKATHRGFWAMFYTATILYLIDMYRLEQNSWKLFILIMVGAIFTMPSLLKKGLWDERFDTSPKTNLLLSIFFSLLFTIVFLIGRVRQIEWFRTPSHALLAGFIFFVFLFITCFVALTLFSKIADKRKKHLEEELEDDKE